MTQKDFDKLADLVSKTEYAAHRVGQYMGIEINDDSVAKAFADARKAQDAAHEALINALYALVDAAESPQSDAGQSIKDLLPFG